MYRAWVSIAGCLLALAPARAADPLPAADGYRGIWYMNQPTEGRVPATSTAAAWPPTRSSTSPSPSMPGRPTRPSSSTAASPEARTQLLHMVSYYDHATGTVPRPAILLDKKTDDAHDNPTLQIDDQGHLWVFSNAHGTGRARRTSTAARSRTAIDAFELVATDELLLPPAVVPARQGVPVPAHALQRRPRPVLDDQPRRRRRGTSRSRWPRSSMGDYQVSWRHGERVGTAFDYHPRPAGLNARTNLYYLETADAGRPGRTVDGTPVTTAADRGEEPGPGPRLPGRGAAGLPEGPAVRRRGRPVILYLTSSGYEPGPENGPRELAHRPLDRRGVGGPPVHDVGPQLRPRLAVHRAGRHLAGHRPDRAGPAAVRHRRRDGAVDQPRPGADVGEGQAADPRQPAQPHLRPPAGGRPPRLLRPVGRRRRLRPVAGRPCTSPIGRRRVWRLPADDRPATRRRRRSSGDDPAP